MQNSTILASAVLKKLGETKYKVGHVTLIAPLIRVICHPYAGT